MIEEKYKYNKNNIRNENGELYKYVTNEVLEEIKNHKDYTFKNNKWKYIGNLNYTNKKYKMHLLACKAYASWASQGDRCNNKNRISYKWYKKSFRLWDSRTFINWWINEFFKREKWICPVVSRFEDKGNYELGNCCLEEKSENAKKVKMTKGRLKGLKIGAKNNAKKVRLINIKDHNDILEFYSAAEAGRSLKGNRHIVKNAILQQINIIYNNKKYKPKYINNKVKNNKDKKE